MNKYFINFYDLSNVENKNEKCSKLLKTIQTHCQIIKTDEKKCRDKINEYKKFCKIELTYYHYITFLPY